MNSFTPRPLTAPEYVLALFAPTDNVAVLVRNRRLSRTLQRITKAEVVASAEFQAALREQNRGGADVFIGMNPIKEGAHSRTKDSLREIRHVYLDIDRNGQQAIELIRSSLDVPTPNFVLHTSPGKYQVVWRVAGAHLEPVEKLLRNMANHLGGDPAATDAARVLRLPGFANRKLAFEFVVEVVQANDDVHSIRDFNLPDESPEAPRRISDGSGIARLSGHHSQSERDWAYALRALARGDDPATVVQRISDYRADDKPDPDYYARLTVTKAQAALATRAIVTPNETDPTTTRTTAAPEH